MRTFAILLASAVAAYGLTARADVIQTDKEAATSVALSRSMVKQGTIKPAQNLALQARTTKAINSTADLEGDYVVTYSAYSSSTGYDGGNAVAVEAIAGTDSISITDFYTSGVTLKAKVDVASKTVTIPNQVLGTTDDYGQYDIALYDLDNDSVMRTQEIVGTIADDGSINFTSIWGVFVVSGDYADYFFGIYSSLCFDLSNATMTVQSYITSTGSFSTQSYGVVVSQTGTGPVTVKNFGNYGYTLDIDLKSDSTAVIQRQVMYADSNGEWLVYEAKWTDSWGVQMLSRAISCYKAVDSRSISWGGWTYSFAKSNNQYYTEKFVDAKIEVSFDLSYPESTQIPLDGDGTADNPYQISTAAEWNALSDYMATENDSLSGKYVKLTNDIDFTGTTVKALAVAGAPTFNADLDGNGKTIKGLSITMTEANSGGLIVEASSGACIHDLNIEGELSSNYSYTAPLVGVLYGRVNNVSSSVSVTGTTSYCLAGIVGWAADSSVVANCTYTGTSNVACIYGAGVVGLALYATVTDCVNTGTMISTYKYVGGVVGLLRYSTMSGCENGGTVDGKDCYGTGGVMGTCNYATITDCHNRGTVIGDYSTGGISAYTYRSEIIGCTNDSTATVTSTGTQSGGLFGCVTTSTSVTGCTNYGTVTGTARYLGGVAGYTSASTLTDCVNYGNVTSSYTYSGGVVGKVDTKCTFENCGNRGSVTYTGSTTECYTAGFTAFCCYGTFTRCFNEGIVEATNSSVGCICGLMGYLMGYGTSTTYVLKECYNTANLTSACYTAGLIVYGDEDVAIDMDGCYNTGNITSTNTTSDDCPSAGLMPYFFHCSSYRNCFNTGDITSSGYVAGLFGYRQTVPTASTPVTITGCYNTGNVTGTSRYVAGVIAHIPAYTTVDSCYNTGTVVCGGYYTGGLAARMAGTGNSTISNCWNAGTVAGAGAYVGGIIGYNASHDAISRCFNVGDVSTTSTSTGTSTSAGFAVGGIAGMTYAALTDVYNAGMITGVTAVGGLVGCPYKAKTTISGGYNSGKIVAAESGGNIIGVGTDNTSYWATGNSITGTYYLTANAVECTDTASTGLTYAQLGTLEISGWVNGDQYTYPILFDNDFALAHAAAIIPTGEDTYNCVTGNFNVGAPDGVTWTSSNGAITFDGNSATFTSSVDATVTLTATCGDATADTEIICKVEVEGVDDTVSDDRTVIDERFFTIDGHPAEVDTDTMTKTVYIVVRVYDDGSVQTCKEVR